MKVYVVGWEEDGGDDDKPAIIIDLVTTDKNEADEWGPYAEDRLVLEFEL